MVHSSGGQTAGAGESYQAGPWCRALDEYKGGQIGAGTRLVGLYRGAAGVAEVRGVCKGWLADAGRQQRGGRHSCAQLVPAGGS